jgi:hypothetical protein
MGLAIILSTVKLPVQGSDANFQNTMRAGDQKRLYRFQIKDEIKAAWIETTKTCRQYVEEPKTSQQRIAP